MEEIPLIAIQDKNQAELIQIIESHPETEIIRDGTCQSAFDYVADLYPTLEQMVRSVKAYKNTNTAFCKKIGIPAQAAGLFLPKASLIILCYNVTFSDDVIIVHELLHYCSKLTGSRMTSHFAEEEFAYLQSIPYLRSKGYSEEWIAKTYLLPYFCGKARSLLASESPSRRKVEEKALEMSMAFLENKKPEISPRRSRFSFLD